MYRMNCTRPEVREKCRRPSCVHPTICKLLGTNHGPLIDLMRQVRRQEGIKETFVASGVRMDLAQDFALSPEMLARYRPGHTRRLPVGSPGSVGFPSLASAQKGELLYRFLLDRISSCLAGT